MSVVSVPHGYCQTCHPPRRVDKIYVICKEADKRISVLHVKICGRCFSVLKRKSLIKTGDNPGGIYLLLSTEDL